MFEEERICLQFITEYKARSNIGFTFPPKSMWNKENVIKLEDKFKSDHKRINIEF